MQTAEHENLLGFISENIPSSYRVSLPGMEV